MNAMDFNVTPGTVYFVGGGPGAPDLITIRGRSIIAQADLVLYADSLVQKSVAALANKPAARIIGSSSMHLEQIGAAMVAAARAGEVVARVHTGDPALYGAIHEQIAHLEAHTVPYEVVPGVTAAFAAAARLGIELTIPETVQTIILSRLGVRTPVPTAEALRGLAAHGASLCLYLSIAHMRQVVDELLAGGAYTPETPAAVVYKVTWPDEQMVTGTLADIAGRVEAAGFTRHALILVSPTLDPLLKRQPPESRLYDRHFAHGYRSAEPHPAAATTSPQPPEAGEQAQPGAPVVVAVTRRGSHLAATLAPALHATPVLPARFVAAVPQHSTTHPEAYEGSVIDEIRRRWQHHRHLVLIMASGIAIRAIAPLLEDKQHDPAVVCLDEAGRSVIPLLSGHQGGANALAQRIAALTGGHAAVTTASDVQAKPAPDLLAQHHGWRIAEGSAITHTSACLVNDAPVALFVAPELHTVRRQAEALLQQADNLRPVAHLDDLHSEQYAAALIITHRRLAGEHRPLLQKSVLYHPPLLVAGIGCRQGVAAEELHAALQSAFTDAGLALESLAALATAALKAEEPGLHTLASQLGLPLHIVEQHRLEALQPEHFTPSAAQEKFGVPGVAEPCAVVAAEGGTLLLPKQRFERCTIAAALRNQGRSGVLALVSIGPGDPAQMTFAAREALNSADIVIGYQSYVEQVLPLLEPHQETITRPMKSEMDRAQEAITLALQGQRVALVSSGDIGIYAMAAPVFESLQQRGWHGNDPPVLVLPGISAFQAAAAHVGAAINHDFCCISLSDLLTPWQRIETRLHAAAQGDFVVALYNPRSKGRDWQLARALEILAEHRPPTTPVVLARNITRPAEAVSVTTLATVDPTQADMLSVVLVGNSQSYRLGDAVVTPRGYTEKQREQAHPTPSDAAPATPPTTYPVSLTHLQHAPVLVVGGGAVGERKSRSLLAAGARVTLISPDATPQLRQWADEGRILWQQRHYAAGDIAPRDPHDPHNPRPLLVFAATSERHINAQVAQEAAALGILCNVADAPHAGSFHLPAVYREGGMVVAISTEGSDPARSRQVRDALAHLLQASEQAGTP
jgi:cobalt-precorrin 5A hydrolase/precorrin-3B C17-methyltransferase